MNDVSELIPTRQSLLSRLKDWNDQESWRVFFDTYWRFIYGAAIKAGLKDAEAQDVVQETVIGVLKSMPTFKYRTESGSFKNWLLQRTRWRIADQLRKRHPEFQTERSSLDTSTGTSAADRVADPASSELEAAWDEEWEKNLMEAALERLKRKVDSKVYQIFDLYVLKKWSVSRVARAMKVNFAYVYMIKHRTSKLLKNEIMQLKSKPI